MSTERQSKLDQYISLAWYGVIKDIFSNQEEFIGNLISIKPFMVSVKQLW